MSDGKNALSAAVAGLLLASGAEAQAPEGWERCYGIVKAGKNLCGANDHACAGKAVRDSDPNEWIIVPKGTCERLAGSSNSPKDLYRPAGK